MLVFCKNPRGVLYIGKYRIYGIETGMPPTDLPFIIYNKCRDGLQDATYREGYLSKKFGKTFPEIAFRYSDLEVLPSEFLDKFGPLLCSSYKLELSHRNKVVKIQEAIRQCHYFP